MKFLAVIHNQWRTLIASWKILSQNRIISLATKFTLLLCTISVLGIIIFWQKLPPIVPLWYSKPWGAERLAPPFWLFLLPASSLVITGINISIASILTNEYLVFSQTLTLSSLVISILSTITLVKIITMVI